MRLALVTLLKFALTGIGALVLSVAMLAGVFAWSRSNIVQAHGRCEMRIIENKIDQNQANEYRRACMKSQGYLMEMDCYASNYSVASCFLPRWVFWINKADF